MKRALLVGAMLCCALLLAGFGQQGAEFGRLGARGKKGASGPAPGVCSPQMNGKFDLSVTCNNIYFLTGVI